MVDYYIRYVDMPSVTKGMTIEDSDGFFNIYIKPVRRRAGGGYQTRNQTFGTERF